MKSATLLKQEEHLRQATTERSAYQRMCAESKAAAEALHITELGRSDNPLATFHYSFDFAQQLHYPANPLQPDFLQNGTESTAVRYPCRGSEPPSKLLDRRGKFGRQGGQCGHFAGPPFPRHVWCGRSEPPAPCRQLFRPEKEQSYDAIFDVACRDWPEQFCRHQFHGGRPYQVCTGLVLRTAQATGSAHFHFVTGGHPECVHDIKCVQHVPACRHAGRPALGAVL